MIIPSREDAVHKASMYRLLKEILDDRMLNKKVYFKGGTCAAMLGWLDRFSVDLDFDLAKGTNKQKLNKRIHLIVDKMGWTISEQSQTELFFIIKYPTNVNRNKLKLSIIDRVWQNNNYESYHLAEINRFARCQTKETMFANKLVAILDRYGKFHQVAGRDIYDTYYFFMQGYGYNAALIEERSQKPVKIFLKDLIAFIKQKLSQKIIDQDLNYLLRPDMFKRIRKSLKQEVLVLLQDEIKRIEVNGLPDVSGKH